MPIEMQFLTFLCLIIFCFSLTLFGQCVCLSGGFYTSDNDLEQSVLLKPLAKNHLNALESEILQLLGLPKRPKPRYHEIHSSAPQYLIDLYSEIKESDGDEKKPKQTKKKHLKRQQTLAYESDFIVSFVNKINQEYPRIRHERDRRFWFDTTKVPLDEEMVAAEFRIFRNNTKRLSKKSKYVLSLYAVTDIDTPNSNTLSLIEEIVISKETGWLAFNVSSTVLNWIAFPAKNLGLYMKIRNFDSPYHSVDPHELGIVCSTGPEKYQPFMVAFFKSTNQLRVKRSARKRQQESYYDHDSYPYGYAPREKYTSYKRRNCQRSTLYVSFKDLGWQDWIIAPDGYGSFFCQGECSFPLNAHMNATNHAIVQTLVHLMDPSVVPKPQCSPTQLSAITVLYFDNEANVILKKYRNMVVKSCGCH